VRAPARAGRRTSCGRWLLPRGRALREPGRLRRGSDRDAAQRGAGHPPKHSSGRGSRAHSSGRGAASTTGASDRADQRSGAAARYALPGGRTTSSKTSRCCAPRPADRK
jgi:hypothetical protein